MPDSKYSKESGRFDCLGLDLNRPVDSIKPAKFPYLKNCRSYVAGRVEPREGLTDIAGSVLIPGQENTHSARRLNDPANDDWTNVVGVGTHLTIGQAAFTDLDAGYSGDPLALVPYRPEASPSSYMYVADRLRMRKVNAAGDLDTIGYAPPQNAPAVALSEVPVYKVISEFDSITGWTAALTATPPTPLTAGTARTSSTIADILYDTGSFGWASVNLASMDGLAYGERLTFAGTETATVQDIFPGLGLGDPSPAVIASIIYDTGFPGMASVVLNPPLDHVAVNSLLRNTSIGQSARVVGVTKGPDGTTSLRINTGVVVWGVLNLVQLLASFRVYTLNSFGAGTSVVNDAMRCAVSTGTGILTLVGALDLSSIVSDLATQREDFMCISLRVNRPDLLTEIKAELNVDATVIDFAQNYYSRVFRASDITAAVRNLQPMVTTRGTAVQREIIETPLPPDQPGSAVNPSGLQQAKHADQLVMAPFTTPPVAPQVVSQQLESGDAQWVPMLFRIGDLIRVGTDDTRTLQNVNAIRITVISTGDIVVDMDSWWIGGGFGPDATSTTSIPYLYRHRVRNPATNVASNWGPATRLGLTPHRQHVGVRPAQYPAPTGTNIVATRLVLDIQRFGGEIGDWHYIGTTPNVASPFFIDKYPDDVVVKLPSEQQTRWQPWPIILPPISGTTGTVAGTTVESTTATFNPNWAPGTEIKIDGVPFTIYRMISATKLETVENMGWSLTPLPWRVEEPVLQAQSLACLWGDEQLGAMFAVGDDNNPGRLYYSNGNDPDSTRETNYIDITSPSEPLMNGVIYNLRSYVFSSERMFQIRPTGNIDGPWIAEEVPNGKGLFARWAITRTPAPAIAVLCKDGIYATTGGPAVSLTNADLYPLFPHEGALGEDIHGIAAPNIVSADQPNLRLDYYDGFLYFDYPQIDGGKVTLVMQESTQAWFWDVYTPNAAFHYGAEGAGVHQLLIGGTDGHLYSYGGDTDNGSSFSMELTTPSFDQGDARESKFYGDLMLDADTDSLTVIATPYFNNNQVAGTPVAVNTADRAQTIIPVSAGGRFHSARNISLNLVATISGAARPKYFIVETRWTFDSAPTSALSWAISASSLGAANWKHMGLVRITHVSTAPLSLAIAIDGVAQPVISVPASGGTTAYTMSVFRVPVYKFKLLEVRLTGGGAEFRLDTRDTYFEIKEWGDVGPYRRLRIFGDFAMVEG